MRVLQAGLNGLAEGSDHDLLVIGAGGAGRYLDSD